MTSSGGTSRPTAQEAQEQVPDHNDAGASQGSTEATEKQGAASSAYEVAAALRAQPSRNRSAPSSEPPPPPSNGSSSAHAGTASSAPAASPPRNKPVPPPSLGADQSATLAPPVTHDPAGQMDVVDSGALTADRVPTAARPQVRRPPRQAQPRRTVRVRKARLRLMRVDPWSVMKTAFLLSVALGVMLFVAVTVLWAVLDSAGVFESVREIVMKFTEADSTSGVDINEYTELSRVLGFTTLIAVVDVVLITALATLGAFLYNLSASLLGGLELTLAEDD